MSRWNNENLAWLGTKFLVLALLLVEVPHGLSQSGNADAQSSGHMQVASIGDSLRRSGDAPLHILYLHGIGATAPAIPFCFGKASAPI
jgi:hypothetical protein